MPLATPPVENGNQRSLGGLVGNNLNTIAASYATGNADGGGDFDSFVGGLVGLNQGGTIIASYATGNLSHGTNVGGLVGLNHGGTITASYSFGTGQGRSWAWG